MFVGSGCGGTSAASVRTLRHLSFRIAAAVGRASPARGGDRVGRGRDPRPPEPTAAKCMDKLVHTGLVDCLALGALGPPRGLPPGLIPSSCQIRRYPSLPSSASTMRRPTPTPFSATADTGPHTFPGAWCMLQGGMSVAQGGMRPSGSGARPARQTMCKAPIGRPLM